MLYQKSFSCIFYNKKIDQCYEDYDQDQINCNNET